MSVYSAFENVAKKQLGVFGVEITFTRTSSSGFDPQTGKNISSTTTFAGYAMKSNYNNSEIDGTIVKNGDIRLMLERTGVVPVSGDIASVNGSGVYRVMNVQHVAPAEEDVIYYLQLRK